jgi:YD repeat-containing protein
VTAWIDPLGRRTELTYDALDRLVSETLPDPDGGGGQTSPVRMFAHDAVGNVVSVTNALSRVTLYEYDAFNRVVEITAPDPDGGGGLTSPVTEYTFDAAGQLTAITDPLGRVTAINRAGNRPCQSKRSQVERQRLLTQAFQAVTIQQAAHCLRPPAATCPGRGRPSAAGPPPPGARQRPLKASGHAPSASRGRPRGCSPDRIRDRDRSG